MGNVFAVLRMVRLLGIAAIRRPLPDPLPDQHNPKGPEIDVLQLNPSRQNADGMLLEID